MLQVRRLGHPVKNKTRTPEQLIIKPEFLPPMSAKAVDKLPEGKPWAYEIKWDGYRVEAIKHVHQVRLFSRKAKDLTTDFPEVRRAVETVKATSAVIDGESSCWMSKGALLSKTCNDAPVGQEQLFTTPSSSSIWTVLT